MGPMILLAVLGALALGALVAGSIGLVVRWRRVRWTLSPYGARNRAVTFMIRAVARFRITCWAAKELDRIAFEHLSGSAH